MILKIRNSRYFKGLALFMIMNILVEIISPFRLLALTGGPSQPEFGAFTPIGTSDMVNLSSGDFSYNIPLMDVGGYPLNLAYSSGIGMDQEASWVGLGWDLNVGAINRNVRGIPDDFKGDKIRYENNLKKDISIGGNIQFNPGLFGIDLSALGLNVSLGINVDYNTINGFSMGHSFGISYELGDKANIGLNLNSTPNGLNLSPSVSLSNKTHEKQKTENSVGGSVGTSFNSRYGLQKTTLSTSGTARGTWNNLKNKKGETINEKTSGGLGSSISYVANTYTPTKQLSKRNGSGTFNASIGTEAFGAEFAGQITGYINGSGLSPGEDNKLESAYGYDNIAFSSQNDVQDFNREKDGIFTINSTNLPLAQNTYDMYTINGQGVSGMFRPYQSQIGKLQQKRVTDFGMDGSFGAEFGAANLAHLGLDIELSGSFGYSGAWINQNGVSSALIFDDEKDHINDEKVYYRNAGQLIVDEHISVIENNFGGYNPIRYGIGGSSFNRTLTSTIYEKSMNNNYLNYQAQQTERNFRARRNQMILKLTKEEAGKFGRTNTSDINVNAKNHHTTEFQIVRQDGATYVYGKALYNSKKIEASFNIGGALGSLSTGLVSFQNGVDNSSNNSRGLDHYFNRITTPSYAHTYLLSEVLSTDYQDLTNDGISDDDLGTYTKFEYVNELGSTYKWRLPIDGANYNEGLRTDPHDDKASYVYGEKDQMYIKKIVTKTHIAIFHLIPRKDALGVLSEGGGKDVNQKSYALDKIELFAKPEYEDFDQNGVPAVPIKVVHFDYGYDLCKGVPNQVVSGDGKLTLKRVYFTYGNSKMGEQNAYIFDYDQDDIAYNPNYNLKGYDMWGNYKPNSSGASLMNDSPISNPEFNYVDQNSADLDIYAQAWSLQRITLPSGGTIEIDYEADDYAFVQDREAMQMYKMLGAGNSFSEIGDKLFDAQGYKEYIYISIPSGITDVNEILDFNEPIYFRSLMNMNMGAANSQKWDYVTGYIFADAANTQISGNVLQIGLDFVDLEGGVAGNAQVNPISKSAWQFGRKYLGPYVYGNPPLQNPGIAAFNSIFGNLLQNIMEIFAGANGVLRIKGIGKRMVPEKSWVRLKNTNGFKKGGGVRVKEIRMSDSWSELSDGNGDSWEYGQEYSYTNARGTMSSGVATYEPVGTKENPFVQPVFDPNKIEHLLAPDEHNYIEEPFGESFFPNPTVTYGRVEVRNLSRNRSDGGIDYNIIKHATGNVVSEFYTSKDYPTITDQTKPEIVEDESNPILGFLNLNAQKHLTASQGYSVHVNDMNGKPKSTRVYGEGQSDFISGVDYLYNASTSSTNGNPFELTVNNTGKLNNTVPVIYPDGSVSSEKIGVEYDITNDFRENFSSVSSVGVNANVASFLAAIFPIIVPIPLPDISYNETKFRSATVTKVVNTFGILRETVAHDAGASVSTKNLLWDAQTGEVLLTETKNEFSDSYYSMKYPAHWGYSGLTQAYHNLNLKGVLTSTGGTSFQYENNQGTAYSNLDFTLHTGDELWVEEYDVSNTIVGQGKRAWINLVSGSTIQLIDEDNVDVELTTGTYLKFNLYRSGRKNMSNTPIMNIVSKTNPLNHGAIGTTWYNDPNGDIWGVINANSVEYSEDWPLSCECGNDDPTTKNPYLNNAKGVWRPLKSWLYLAGRTTSMEMNEATIAASTNSLKEPKTRIDGSYSKFSPFYQTTGVVGGFFKNTTDWTWNSEVTQFSPFGFELENKDALDRYSAAQYGYSNMFPLAVGANSKYSEMGYDGFEDYLDGECTDDHFSFKGAINGGINALTNTRSHTGRKSIVVGYGSPISIEKRIGICPAQP